MKIDLHVHASELSECAVSTEEEQVQAAAAVGLNAFFFCNHHHLVPRQRLAELNQRYAPFLVFNGVEITTDGEDVLVLGVDDPALESSAWNYPNLHAFVRRKGGYMVLAHPFRWRPEILIDIERYTPDAVEIGSNNVAPEWRERIAGLARQLGMRTLCNSDAHVTTALGKYYNCLNRPAGIESEALDMLRAGEYASIPDYEADNI